MSLASTEYQRRWRAKKRQAEIAAGLRPPPKKAATSTERSRRYRAKLKAAATQAQAQAQDSTGLQRKNAALRRKITVREQELAQQRAMAKQEGLGMKATRAAMTKPNGGFVGVLDENFEFHEFLSPPPNPLSIPSWVPEEARPAIKKKWEETLPDEEIRMALKRLATDGRMRRVWEKLRKVKGVADVAEIIPWAIEAIVMFPVLRRPPQSKRREEWERYGRHWRKLGRNHSHLTRGLMTCAGSATDLRYALENWRELLAPTGDELWSYYWRGDPAMSSMGVAISFLRALQDCLIAIEKEQQSDVKRFPPIARPDDPRAPQRFFAQFMSDPIMWVCGRPRHDILAELVCVAFDVDDVNTNTVREWCRKTGA
jgi:hypothetical protein